MGRVDAETLNKLGENVAALCDVDSGMLEQRGAQFPKAAKYTDFRKMIEREKLDGVVVATPDHWHAYISVWAMKHGLHVYCQKPLTQTIHESRVMARVASETKAITQMGTASTSEANVLRQVELIQSGALGEIVEVHVSTDRPVWPQGYDRPQGQDPVPSRFDWDMWLGPAAARPYQGVWAKEHPVYKPESWKRFIYQKDPDLPIYHPFTWRGWTEFGSGAVGDIAPHAMNVIFMALDLGAPSAVEVVETSGMRREMYPEWSIIRFDWAQRGCIRRSASTGTTAASSLRPRSGEAASSGSGPRVVCRRIGDRLEIERRTRTKCLHSRIGVAKRSTRTGLRR
jgi:predicted dehydrogenase